MELNPRAVRWILRGGVLAIAAYYAVWGGEYSVGDLRQLRGELERESVQLAAARAETDSLRTFAQRLERDPATIERVARERFGMIRPGETLVRFVEPDTAEASPPSENLARLP